MRLLYISNIDISNPKAIGIVKKVFGQIGAFQKLGYQVDLLLKNSNTLLFYDTNRNNCLFGKSELKDSFSNTIRRNDSLGYLERYLINKRYDTVYLRFVALNIGTVLFFRNAKERAAITVLEIPTYPYLNEQLLKLKRNSFISNLKLFKKLAIDCLVRIILKKYVDFIVLTIPKRSLWKIPTVSIENGIDLQTINIQNKKVCKNTINLFTATNIDVWQGLDRLILGLHIFFSKNVFHPDIRIKIAGDGFEKNNLVALTNKLHLERNVIFCGTASGSRLEELYDEADIAIGSLGRHRQHTNTVSTLKVKEYCAKGIPFIYSNDEPSLSGKEIFALKLPATDDPIDFSDVIKFHDKVCKNDHLRYEIRNFAEKYDWLNQVKKIHAKSMQMR